MGSFEKQTPLGDQVSFGIHSEIKTLNEQDLSEAQSKDTVLSKSLNETALTFQSCPSLLHRLENLETIQKELKELQSKNVDTEKECEQLQQDLEIAEKEREYFMEELAKSRQKCTEFEREIANIYDMHALEAYDLKNELKEELETELTIELDNSEHMNKNLIGQLAKSQNKHTKVKEELIKFQEECTKVKEELTKVKEELIKSQENCTEVEKELAKSKDCNENLQTELDTLKMTLGDTEDRCEDLEERISEIYSKNELVRIDSFQLVRMIKFSLVCFEQYREIKVQIIAIDKLGIRFSNLFFFDL